MVYFGITWKLLDTLFEHLFQFGPMRLQRNGQGQQIMDASIPIPDHFLDVSIVSDAGRSIVAKVDAVNDGLVLVEELEVE